MNRRELICRLLGTGLVLPALSVGANGLLAASPTSGSEITDGLSFDEIASQFSLDASAVPPAPVSEHLKFGTTRRARDGRVIAADSRSLLLDGAAWLPVMGEFHYARYPAEEWREELLKMKAGGIDLLATYIFWIHHEEREGEFDWTGRRDLRRFVTTANEVGLPCVVRLGPWCHGEVRNGGLPDWLMQKGWKLRGDEDANYLAKVKILYAQIAAQLKGLLWKDGGTIIGAQVENEYRGAAEHLLTLKTIAREAGIDVPLYTRTGWPTLRTPMPRGELFPLYGSYADGFWDRNLTAMPGAFGEAFSFKTARNDAEVATDQLGRRITKDGDDASLYPYFCCEIGGGMERSYHRRILIYPTDVLASALVKFGSGNNLQGYYMYHGGTNPPGKLSTLQESQATNYWNDVPVKSYDFQAPLGEFGQINPHYHQLRLLHLFARDFGAALATYPARLPARVPATSRDHETLRWAARTDGKSGYIFINNYQRLQPMPAKSGVQFALKLRDDARLSMPAQPFDVPADSAFFLPFNLKIGGVKLIYATAQPVCKLAVRDTTYLIFAEIANVPAEFAFDRKTVSIIAANGAITNDGGRTLVKQVKTGTSAAISLIDKTSGKKLSVVLLDERQALGCWKGGLAGRERIFLSRANLVFDGDKLRLVAEDAANLSVAVLPAPKVLRLDGGRNLIARADGVFRRYVVPTSAPPERNYAVPAVQVQPAGAARVVKIGSKGVAEAPTNEDFTRAAVWRVHVPRVSDTQRDLLLQINYVGDAARLYLDGELLTDNFYNGKPFEFGLRRYAPAVYEKELLLKILPLRKDAPIYLQSEARPVFGTAESIITLKDIALRENLVARLVAR